MPRKNPSRPAKRRSPRPSPRSTAPITPGTTVRPAAHTGTGGPAPTPAHPTPIPPAAASAPPAEAAPAGLLDPALPPPPPTDWPAAAPAPPPRGDRPPFRYRSVPEDLAIHLAHRLNDMASLEYYLRLTNRWTSGRLLPRMERIAVGHTLMRKAAALAAQGPPRGPLRNPAAVFVTWVRALERVG